MDCPFYRLICRRRKKKCIGYFEGFTDAQALMAAEILSEGLKNVVITEEGVEMFKKMGCWKGDET